MSNIFHKDFTGLDNHTPHTFEYADDTTRLAAIGFDAEDVGKWAFQLDTKEYWRLDDTAPTWVAVGGGDIRRDSSQLRES